MGTWPLWGFIPTALFALWRRRNSRMQYEKMIRLNQVSIILASIDLHNSRFSLRVLKERRLEDLLFGDAHAQRLVLAAARKTTKEHPLLAFKDPKKDSWPIQLAVISNLYEQFADGLVQADMGLLVHSEWYAFSISCYPDEESSRKIRVYLIKMSVLHNIYSEAQLDAAQYQSWRRSRKNAFHVLKEMARIAREHREEQSPARGSHEKRGYDMPPQLGRVELTMRATYCTGCSGIMDRRPWYLDTIRGRTSLGTAINVEGESQKNAARVDGAEQVRGRSVSEHTSQASALRRKGFMLDQSTSGADAAVHSSHHFSNGDPWKRSPRLPSVPGPGLFGDNDASSPPLSATSLSPPSRSAELDERDMLLEVDGSWKLDESSSENEPASSRVPVRDMRGMVQRHASSHERCTTHTE